MQVSVLKIYFDSLASDRRSENRQASIVLPACLAPLWGESQTPPQYIFFAGLHAPKLCRASMEPSQEPQSTQLLELLLLES
ncbi:hypothetical protein SeMB42_g00714 [Synchytrium endobioticum]|uniref:Uncharacterized protein n=1 Tax=Synchytrium endobioticum TaxID=286115 RepID=A0A507DRP1_9FUNG|nr:hypothetical protein SeMB42_g00714 [Synchytrium endobioticum]